MPSAHTLAIQEKLSQPWIGSTPRSETWRLGQKGDCFSNGPGSGEGGNGTSIPVTELALTDRRKLTPQKAGVELDLNSPRLCSPLPLLSPSFLFFFFLFSVLDPGPSTSQAMIAFFILGISYFSLGLEIEPMFLL